MATTKLPTVVLGVGLDRLFLLDDDADEQLLAVQSAGATSLPRGRAPYRACVNCGKLFRVSPSSKTRTCSKQCSSRHRSRKHLGKSNTWSGTKAARFAAARTGNLRLGTPAARVSARSGPFETNINAKEWLVVAPSGDRYLVKNLRLWCERSDALFAPHSWKAAYAGLRQVGAWLRGKTPRQVSQWRGWSLEDAPTSCAQVRKPAAI